MAKRNRPISRLGKRHDPPASCARCGCSPSFPHFVATQHQGDLLRWRTDVMYCTAFCARAAMRDGEIVVDEQGSRVWPKEVA